MFQNIQRTEQKETEMTTVIHYVDHVAKSSLSLIEFAKSVHKGIKMRGICYGHDYTQ